MRLRQLLRARVSGALLLVALIGASGCMFQPDNESTVCAVDQPMTFSGNIFAPGGLVRIESADNPGGPFTPVTQVFAGPRNLFGMAAWRMGDVVPTWSGTLGSAGIRETYVRAWIGNSAFQFFLRTFDSAEVARETGLECIIRVAAAQQISALSAAIQCTSPASPIVRITASDPSSCACPTLHTGNITITDVETVHLYQCLQDLDGSLIIPKGYPGSISLPALQNVTGDVILDYTPEGYDEPSRTIDLPMLVDIGGDLEVLFDLYSYFDTIFPIGLDAVTSVGGNITIAAEVAFPNWSGLSALTAHSGNVTITAPTDGLGGQLMANLATITGDVHLEFTQAFENPLPGLQALNGNLTIVNWSDFNTSAFSQLATVTGDVTLQDVDFPAPMFAPSMSVGGTFSLIGDSTNDLGIYAATSLTPGALTLDMSELHDLAQTNVQVQGAGTIEITNNGCLEANEISGFLATQQAGGWTGASIVSGNGGGLMCP